MLRNGTCSYSNVRRQNKTLYTYAPNRQSFMSNIKSNIMILSTFEENKQADCLYLNTLHTVIFLSLSRLNIGKYK